MADGIASYLTPADILARGLGLAPLPIAPRAVPEGTTCAITGQPISCGYSVSDIVTGATNEFLDCFRGGIAGYVSDVAARCFKASNPREGNPASRTVLIFEDGTYYNPLIARESALQQARPCWTDLVRQIWPERAGQRMLMILTTDMKRRLWIRARVGALGARTPVFYYDSDTASNEVLLIDWPRLLDCLNLVEEVYTGGFVKAAIRESLWRHTKAVGEVGFIKARAYENALTHWRRTPEFQVATLIAQKGA